MKRNRLARTLLVICRMLFGLTFLFSGFVKAVDPLGTAYKIGDYLDAFGIGELSFLAVAAAFVLIIIEFSIGFCMFFGIFVKQTSWVASAFMLFMTGLTLYIAIDNPVSDCGCFGDAVKLDNWHTFYKNIALDIILAVILICMRQYKEWLQPVPSAVMVLIAVLICLSIETYCYRHLPIIDFRPYKIGNNIPSLMTVPEGMPADRYETTFIYEKDGVRKEFGLDNFPADDSTWTFVDSKTVLVEKGYEPPIHDFSLQLPDMGDITDIVLENPGYTWLLVYPRLDKADTSEIDRINEIFDFADNNNMAFFGMTSSSDDEIDKFTELHNIKFRIATTDEITLKTIIRSNPGLVLLKKGTVTGKWHYNDLPDDKEIKSITTNN